MNLYTSQDGLKYELQNRVNGAAPFGDKRKEFPNGKDYIKIFQAFEQKMNAKWHENVNLGAAINRSGLLTDHGVEHVQDVIRHAGEILSDIQQLTGYEIFILLLAIHFHDVGNIYGRAEHEQKIADIINSLDKELELSTPEKQLINDIATAHGGYYENDKDTICHIGSDTKFGNVQIRPKILAAILRFADEISDDLNRSAPLSIKPPKENEVFHEYSKALDPISIEGETILLHYHIPFRLTQNKVGKAEKTVYLYDEIIERIAKCMRELEYCKKYAAGLIRVSSLSVKIDIIKDCDFRIIQGKGDCFRLTIQGYPDHTSHSFQSYMEKQNASTGSISELRYKNGSALKKSLKEVTT